MLSANIGLKIYSTPLFWASICAGLLTACGGSGGGGNNNGNPPNTDPSPQPSIVSRSGRIVDSAIAGLEYRSGSLQGITNQAGQFEYEEVDGVAQAVTFSFNGVAIGATTGQVLITPLSLVANSDLNTTEVVNIARFVQMLDTDGNADNGIVPSDQLLNGLNGFDWQTVDFSDPDFSNQAAVTTIVADLSSIDSQSHSLPSIQQAQSHLQSSLACLSSGIISGRFQGEDSGHFVMLLQHQRVDAIAFGDSTPRIGVSSALIYSEDQDRLIGVSPLQALSFNSNNFFIVGDANNGAEFTADFSGFSSVQNGRWNNPIEGGSGTFSGERAAGNGAAIYRLSGAFGDNTPANPFDLTPDNSGGIAIDIFIDNTVSGVAVTSRGEHIVFTGQLDGDTISAQSSSGLSLSLTFDVNGNNPLNLSVGLGGVAGFWGAWSNTDNNTSGLVGGTSCQLN